MIFGDEWKCEVTPYEIKELGLGNDTKTASLIILKSLDSNVMSRPRRPLPVYFRKRNFFFFSVSAFRPHINDVFGHHKYRFRKRSTELRFWKQRLTALMYWRSKTENFKPWCHTPYHKQCAFPLRVLFYIGVFVWTGERDSWTCISMKTEKQIPLFWKYPDTCKLA